MNDKVSIVFRALNEEKWLAAALQRCLDQKTPEMDVEILLVDSGSTDRTLDIAQRFGCRIVHIKKSDFTFGRSLNYGCEAANGDYLVFISAHCIPAETDWLSNLIAPLKSGLVDYSYGKQIGHDVTRFSEHQVFSQYYGDVSKIPQDGFFANNANAAIRKDQWARYRFDESVTGLEDMVLAKAIVKDGGKIGYVADAPVIHIHEESFEQTQRRYYREALTLREIMPEVHFNLFDLLRYYFASLFHDFAAAAKKRNFLIKFPEIVVFRWMQFWGTYRGHNEHRILSRAQKEQYYYPRPKTRAHTADSSTTEDPHLSNQQHESA